jgi:hypothetical protein
MSRRERKSPMKAPMYTEAMEDASLFIGIPAMQSQIEGSMILEKLR